MADHSVETQTRLQIGEWTVKSSANELCLGEVRVHVEPKAMEPLLVLAARAGEAVSREALLEAVWPGLVIGDCSNSPACCHSGLPIDFRSISQRTGIEAQRSLARRSCLEILFRLMMG